MNQAYKDARQRFCFGWIEQPATRSEERRQSYVTGERPTEPPSDERRSHAQCFPAPLTAGEERSE